MPPATRNYGFARDCAVCGARIRGTPKSEIMLSRGGKLVTFPICGTCEADEREGNSDLNREMLDRRIASGAYKIAD